jgi:thiamine biosynthesis lipoprotein
VARFAIEAMATRFEVVLPDAPPAIGELLLHEIAEWHHRLNRFAPDSWVSHVNRTAASTPVRCDEDVWGLLVDAQDAWRASGGAFDITRGHGDALRLNPDTRTVQFDDPSMRLDLGGIAKGHALECCGRLLRQHGVTSAFLHGGTSSGLAIGLDPATGQPWRVDLGTSGLRDFGTSGLRDFGTSGLRDFGTSGLRDFAFSVSDAGAQAHAHIIDPRSGELIERNQSSPVMVTGPSARLCEAWSTAVVVMGEATQVPPGYSVTITTR